MWARRMFVSAGAAVLLLTACTSNDTPDADRPASSRDEPVDPPDDPADEPVDEPDTPTDVDPSTSDTGSAPGSTDVPCDPVTVVDEYGFPVEIDDCGGELPPDAQSAVAALPPSATRDALGAALRAAEQLAADCHGIERWTELATSTATGFANVAALVADEAGADGAISSWVGSPSAYVVLRRLVADATTGACPPDRIGPEVDPGALAAAGRLAGAVDDLSSTLDIVGNLGITGEFWYHADQVGHTADLLALGPDGRAAVDVVALGPSTVKRGIDPGLVTELTGRRTYLAAVGALAVDLQLTWWEQLRDLGLDPTTVIVGLNTWIEMEACPDPQAARVLATDERRTVAFSGVDGVAPAPDATRFVGGDEPTYASRLLDNYRALWLPGGGAFSRVTDDPLPDVEALQVEQFLAQPITELCPARLERTEQLLATIARDVPELLVVVLPTSERMAGLHPEGWAAHEAVVDRYRAMAAEVGARFVDRSRSAPEERFVDLTHLGATGRAELTADLARALLDGDGDATTTGTATSAP